MGDQSAANETVFVRDNMASDQPQTMLQKNSSQIDDKITKPTDKNTSNTIPNNESIYEWWYHLFYNMIKEMLAVIAFFICNSRIGASDPAATPLILFATLVIFSFPYMNPYLFTFLRTGPWLRKKKTESYLFFIFLQVVLMTGAQIGGAFAAAAFRIHLSKDYGYESLNTPTGYLALRLLKKCDHNNSTQVNLFPPYFASENIGGVEGQCFENLKSKREIWWVFEEMFGVAAFLIGTIHIIEAIIPRFLINTFWNSQETEKNQSTEKQQSNQTLLTGSYNPIPIQFIAVESIFFAAILKAFPTSHLALHVSFYFYALQLLDSNNKDVYAHQDETGIRIAGGIIGTFLASMYYFLVHTQADKAPLLLRILKNRSFLNTQAQQSTTVLPITFKRNDEFHSGASVGWAA